MAVRQLSSIYNNIKVALEKREEDLGELREKDPERHKDELKKIVFALRNLEKEGASGNYSEKMFFVITEDGLCWLRSKIADQGRTFSEEMRSKGHNSIEFKWKPDEKLPTDPMSAEVSQMFLAMEILGKLKERKATAIYSLEMIEEDRGDAALSMNPGIWMGSRELMVGLSERLNKTAEPTQQTSTTPGRTTGQTKTTHPNKSQEKLGTQAKAEFSELDIVSRFNALKFLQNTLTLYMKCRETYIDNMLVQVVQRNLLRNFEDLFTHEWIDDEAKFNGIIEDPDRSGRLEKQNKLKEEIDILSWSLKELEPMIGKLSSPSE
ncbi:hypothetical protein BKA65DRAFT_481387 [Rhexocercosporidium sp. MPI-PUGE-AT-0058]|nr:hypothetical protein BKA65DRAFT_481387 [Rhexocercosporidium sp. MPI-PUGE-AT-0058]